MKLAGHHIGCFVVRQHKRGIAIRQAANFLNWNAINRDVGEVVLSDFGLPFQCLIRGRNICRATITSTAVSGGLVPAPAVLSVTATGYRVPGGASGTRTSSP